MKICKRMIGLFTVCAVLLSIPILPAYASEQADVSDALNRIVIETETVEDFALPLTDLESGVNFSWTSSDNTSILPVNGKAYVMPDVGAKQATLTVTGTKGEASEQREIQITVGAYTYTGDYLINENFEGSLDEEIWRKDAAALPDSADGSKQNFMGTDTETGEAGNKVFKIIRTDNSGDNAAKKSFMHINQAVPSDTRIIYESRVRVGQQPKDNRDRNIFFNYWLCRDAGNAIGKYSGFATAYIGGENGLQVKSPNDQHTDQAYAHSESILNQWVQMTFDVTSASATPGTFDFYLNGELKAQQFVQRAGAAGLQHTAFGFDTNQSGELWLDDYRIYQYPETADTLLEGQTLGVTDLSAVDTNLTLPELDGASITWVSDHPDILAPDGTIDQNAITGESAAAALYAVVDNCGVKTAKKYDLIIKAAEKQPSELDDLDLDAIVGDQSATSLTKGFTLPGKTPGGLNITWESSDSTVLEIVNNTAAVIKPTETAKTVMLTASITENEATVTRTFPLGIAAAAPLDSELNMAEIVGQDLGCVIDDFILPEKTKNGYSVTWESSVLDSLFLHHNQAYVIRNPEDKQVTLTAWIEKDGAKVRLDTPLTVGKVDEITSYLVDEDFESIAVGELPASTALSQWGKDSSVSDSNQNIQIGAIPEEGNEANRILCVNHIKKDNIQHGMMHLNFNGPKKGSIVAEYRYKFISSEAGSNPNVWFNASSGYNAAPSNNFAKFPFNDAFIVAQAGSNRSTRVTYPGGQWHDFKAVINLNTMKFDMYVDGKKECSNEPAIEGNGFMRIQIGFDNGHEGKIYMDDFKIYVDPVSVVENYANSIDLGNLSAVVKDLEIPEKTPLGEADIIWISSNPDVVSTAGKVNNPTAGNDIPVTLWALVDYDGIRHLKTFEVNVSRIKTDAESVESDFADLDLPTAGLCLDDKLRLPTSGAQGSVITWSSDHPEIIAADGTVTRLPYDAERITEVTLTATVSKGSTPPKTKTFTLRVPERNYVLDAAVTGSSSKGDGRFEFVKDNDALTSWSPAEGDKKKMLVVTLKNPSLINMIRLNGICNGVSVSYMPKGTNTYNRLGSGTSLDFEAKMVQAVKFEFSGGAEISSIGIYFNASDEDAVKADMNSVDLGNLDAVISDIKIPASGPMGSTITSVSSNHDYLTDNGKVTRPSNKTGDVDVTLTLTFQKGGYRDSKDYPVHILKSSGGGSNGSGGITHGGSNIGGGSGLAPAGPVAAATPEPQPVQDAFEDLASVPWAKEAINAFAAKGFIHGTADGSFEPERAITREEFLKMAMNAFGLSAGHEACTFTDVPEDSWFYDYVASACRMGMINGIGGGRFGSGQPILRGDMAVMIQKAARIAKISHIPATEARQFTDEAEFPDYMQDSIKTLSGLGVINGFEDGSFRPMVQADRAQAAVMLYQYLNLK